MVLTKTDENEVHKSMKELKNKESTGHDIINNELLKYCSSILEKYLVKTFNICLEERKVPQCMKIAKIFPLFRNGDRNDPESFCSISLPTSMSKLFEKVLNKRMVRFFQKNKLFSPT